MSVHELDDDHPMWLINEQIKGLLEGDGADEDHEAVLNFLCGTGLPEGTVKRIHKALVCAELKEYPKAALDAAVTAEREACAQLCKRPVGWLNPSQQKVANEIWSAILARSNIKGDDK